RAAVPDPSLWIPRFLRCAPSAPPRSPRCEERQRRASKGWSGSQHRYSSEVALLLAVLHGGVAESVVATGGATLGQAGDRDPGADLWDGCGRGLDASRERKVADGAKAHCAFARDLAGTQRVVLALGEEHPVPLEDPPLVRVVDLG